MQRGQPVVAILFLCAAACALWPRASSAEDGVIELNQACATQTGCLAGDSAGFPISINHRGSYRLTSDLLLVAPDHNYPVIAVDSPDVSLDLNSFSLIGPNTLPIPPGLTCPADGGGRGIAATEASGGLTISNGRIRGMPNSGIYVPASTARLDRMILEGNCWHGAELGTAAMVLDSQARGNIASGFVVGHGSLVRGCIAEWNGAVGIYATASSIITNSVASSNGSGIALQSGGVRGGVIMGNSAARNRASGIDENAGGAAVLSNSVSENASVGIDVENTSALGLNSSVANASIEYSGGVTIGCNSADATKTCP